jgi:hypothetical protein
MPNDRFGSIASLWPRAEHFRSSPDNGHRERWSACLKTHAPQQGDLFDHLVGASKKGVRNLKAKRLSRLEIEIRSTPDACNCPIVLRDGLLTEL